MKIGILQTDSVREEFKAEFGDYPDMFKALLSKAAKDPLEFAVYDVEHQQYPVDINDCDAYLITGSRHSAYADLPWIHRFKEYVLELHKAKKKLVGICFGHQIIAIALGGKTELAGVGWGVGLHWSDIADEQPYMKPALPSFAALVSHQDQVTQLPEGAQLLASSEFCPNSMFQIGNHILTFQGHPEFLGAYSRVLMDMRQDLIGEDIYLAGVKSLEHQADDGILAQWILGFCAH